MTCEEDNYKGICAPITKAKDMFSNITENEDKIYLLLKRLFPFIDRPGITDTMYKHRQVTFATGMTPSYAKMAFDLLNYFELEGIKVGFAPYVSDLLGVGIPFFIEHPVRGYNIMEVRDGDEKWTASSKPRKGNTHEVLLRILAIRQVCCKYLHPALSIFIFFVPFLLLQLADITALAQPFLLKFVDLNTKLDDPWVKKFSIRELIENEDHLALVLTVLLGGDDGATFAKDYNKCLEETGSDHERAKDIFYKQMPTIDTRAKGIATSVVNAVKNVTDKVSLDIILNVLGEVHSGVKESVTTILDMSAATFLAEVATTVPELLAQASLAWTEGILGSQFSPNSLPILFSLFGLMGSVSGVQEFFSPGLNKTDLKGMKAVLDSKMYNVKEHPEFKPHSLLSTSTILNFLGGNKKVEISFPGLTSNAQSPADVAYSFLLYQYTCYSPGGDCVKHYIDEALELGFDTSIETFHALRSKYLPHVQTVCAITGIGDKTYGSTSFETPLSTRTQTLSESEESEFNPYASPFNFNAAEEATGAEAASAEAASAEAASAGAASAGAASAGAASAGAASAGAFNAHNWYMHPIGGGHGPDEEIRVDANMNTGTERAQLFAALDACGVLREARRYKNAAGSDRPSHSGLRDSTNMHLWCEVLADSFRTARQNFARDNPDEYWEEAVKTHPKKAFPSSLIGSLPDSEWETTFPLISKNHALYDDITKVRSLFVMWGDLNMYKLNAYDSSRSGAWMPLSPSHMHSLYNEVGLFDEKYRVQSNPWLAHEGRGVSKVYNQSYHSPFPHSSYKDKHFKDWVKRCLRYKPPSRKENKYYPFSQYGGHFTEADMLPHRVELSDNMSRRQKQIISNRFGCTTPLCVGQSFPDTGLLQDLFSRTYRSFADLSAEQRRAKPVDAVYPSNFMAYARVHAINALASCAPGTEDISVSRAVRSFYRSFVNTYECMGKVGDEGVPVVLGYVPFVPRANEDRRVCVTYYAGTLGCMNTLLSNFCRSPSNANERICQMYKQALLNEATLLYMRLLKNEHRKEMNAKEFNLARRNRAPGYSYEKFLEEKLSVLQHQVDFMHTTFLSHLIGQGTDLKGIPLEELEARDAGVPEFAEDPNVLPGDYDTPLTLGILRDMDISTGNLTKQKMAMIHLLPSHEALFNTMRLHQDIEVYDLNFLRKEIQKQAMAFNEDAGRKYANDMVRAALAARFLSTSGGVDLGFDMPAPIKFKDPLVEAEKIPKRITTSGGKKPSLTSMHVRHVKDRTGTDVSGMDTKKFNQVINAVNRRVEETYEQFGGSKTYVECLNIVSSNSFIPQFVKNILISKYQR